MSKMYARAAGISPRQVEAHLFVAVRATNRIHELDAMGTALWNALATPRSAEEIVTLFVDAFPDVAPATIRRDMTGALVRMTKDGLITVGAASEAPIRGTARRRRARQ